MRVLRGHRGQSPSRSHDPRERARPRGRVAAFFLIAYAISWTLWAPLAVEGLGLADADLPKWWHLLGAAGPALAATIVVARWAGVPGLAALARRAVRFRGAWGLLVFAALSVPAAFVATSLLEAAVTGSAPDLSGFGRLGELGGLAGLGGWAVWVLTFGFGEETGWRGFAQPELERSWSPAAASVVVGLLWAGWHTPLFAYRYEASLIAAVGLGCGIVAGSVVLAWLFGASGGGVLAPALWHGGYNASVADAPPVVATVVTAVVIAWAITLMRAGGPDLRDPWPGWNRRRPLSQTAAPPRR